MFAVNRVNRLIAAGSETRFPARRKHVTTPTDSAGGTGAAAPAHKIPSAWLWLHCLLPRRSSGTHLLTHLPSPGVEMSTISVPRSGSQRRARSPAPPGHGSHPSPPPLGFVLRCLLLQVSETRRLGVGFLLFSEDMEERNGAG